MFSFFHFLLWLPTRSIIYDALNAYHALFKIPFCWLWVQGVPKNVSILHFIFFEIGQIFTKEGALSKSCLIRDIFKHVSLLYRIYKKVRLKMPQIKQEGMSSLFS